MFQKAIQVEVDKMKMKKKKNQKIREKKTKQGTQIISEVKRTQHKDKVFVFNVL